MKKFSTIGVFAHANAGKTSFTEAFLLFAGAITEIGSVDGGTTTTDSLDIEKARGISVKSAFLTVEFESRVVQIVDTPGHLDFSTEVRKVIPVLDMAILVISAAEGIQPYTKVLWDTLKSMQIPVLIFVNKIDRAGVDLPSVVADINRDLDPNSVQMQTTWLTDDGYKVTPNSDLSITEQIVQTNDKLLERYLSDAENLPTANELLAHEFGKNAVTPIYFGSALKNIGMIDAFRFIAHQAPVYHQDKDKEHYKIFSIENAEKHSNLYVKVLSGTISLRELLESNVPSSKITGLFTKTIESLRLRDSIQAGEICMIQGPQVEDLSGWDRFLDSQDKINLSDPLFVVEVSTNQQTCQSTLHDALSQLNKENSLNLRFNQLTRSFTIDLRGELQQEIIESELEERFKIRPVFGRQRLILKEAPERVAEATASYGSFSAVSLRITPRNRGEGLLISELPAA